VVKPKPVEFGKLAARLDRVVSRQRGKKAEAARELSVPAQRISDWISLRRVPDGETTLRLDLWVAKQEEEFKKQKGRAGATNTSPAVTQRGKLHEKTHQSRKRR
jgi:hypothetical protein